MIIKITDTNNKDFLFDSNKMIFAKPSASGVTIVFSNEKEFDFYGQTIEDLFRQMNNHSRRIT